MHKVHTLATNYVFKREVEGTVSWYELVRVATNSKRSQTSALRNLLEPRSRYLHEQYMS